MFIVATANFYLTDAGKAAALDATNASIDIEITQIALGTAKYDAQATAPTQTALTTEMGRYNLAGGGSNGQVLRLTTTITPNYTADIFEIGLFLSDGTLFAVAAVTGTDPLMQTANGLTSVITLACSLADVGSNVTVSVDANSPLAVVLMNQHIEHSDPHPQYALKSYLLSKVGGDIDSAIDYLVSLINLHAANSNPHPQYLLASTFGVNMLMDASAATEIVDANRVFGWDGESGDTFCFDKSVRWWNYHDQEVTFKPFRAYGKFLLSIFCMPEGDGLISVKIYNKNNVLLSDAIIWEEHNTVFEQVVNHLFELEVGGYAKIRLWGRPWNDSYAYYKGSIYVNDRVRRFVPVGYQSLVDAFDSSQDGSTSTETPIDYSDFSPSEWSRFDSGLNDNVGLLSGTTFTSPESTVPHYHRALFAGNADTDLWIAIEVGTQLVQSPSDYAAVGSVVIRGTTDEDGNIVITIPLSMRSVERPNDETLVYQVAYYTTEVTKTTSDTDFPIGSADGVHIFYANL